LSPCPGKQEPGVGLAPGTSRVRARRGEERDTVRDLPTAGVLGAGAGGLPARGNTSSAWACIRKEPCACETRGRKDTVRELLGAAAGFFPARENRSSVRACTWNQPRACAVQMQTQTRCASCPAQPRGEEADRANRFVGSRHTT